jgi:NAD(P)-dependent dehydrogenase (short-subunit alcohol dehydrogenase family)
MGGRIGSAHAFLMSGANLVLIDSLWMIFAYTRHRKMGECQAAVAEAVNLFGKLDIVLWCTSQTVVGSVEELAASPRTLSLVRDQFETNYFGPVNIVKSALPLMRKQREGHFLVLTGISKTIHECKYEVSVLLTYN